MSGPPPSYYLTPPDKQPAPAYSGPGFAAPQAPGFAAPQAPAWQDPSAQAVAWQDPSARPAPASTNPLIAFAMGTGTMSGQFSGPAVWSIVVGLLGIGLPFFTPFYFRFLPVAGMYTGVRAIMSGRLIGGGIGLGLNAIAAIFSLFYMGVIHR